MPMFIVLGKMTDQGAKTMRDIPQMVAQNRAHGEKIGIKLHHWYLTQGQYDFVVIVEAPDAETMAAQTMAIAGRGNSRSETLRAYPLEEIDQITQKLS